MKNNNKGITLIALIITIIVMLILVAVTINMAVNGGLFGYAGNAAKDTEKAKKAEEAWANPGEGMSTDQLIAKYTTDREKDLELLKRAYLSEDENVWQEAWAILNNSNSFQEKNFGNDLIVVLYNGYYYKIITNELGDYIDVVEYEPTESELIQINGSYLGAEVYEYNNNIYDISNGEVVLIGAKNEITMVIGGDDYILLNPSGNQTWYQWATDETNNEDIYIDPGYDLTGKYLKDVIKECYEINEDYGINTAFAYQYAPGYPVLSITFYIDALVSDVIEIGRVYVIRSYS